MRFDAPSPVYRTSLAVAASLVGDSALYVVLPVVFQARGFSPMQVGLILSANRWARLFTNAPAAKLLGTAPVRIAFACALVVGGACSFLYCSRSLVVVVAARCLWGGCWSILRLAGMLTVTDCIEAGMAPESVVGRLTGLFSGLARLGSAFGMAAGGVLCDRIGFEAFFALAALLTLAAAPLGLSCTFGALPRVSVTAARTVSQAPSEPTIACHCCPMPSQLSRLQRQLMALAFSASCAGNGLIVSTLGVVLASYSTIDDITGEQVMAFGD
eukprot:5686084-Prymnesium_polylepis.1